MPTNTSHSAAWACLTAATLLLSLGQAAMVGAEDSPGESNVPPPGFTALFNGKDFTGWRMSPKAKEMWFIEDGVLKSPGLLRQWGADLVTEKDVSGFCADARFPDADAFPTAASCFAGSFRRFRTSVTRSSST